MKRTKETDEAKVQAMIAADPDNPEWTDEDFAKARPFAEVFPALAESMRKSKAGRPPAENPKVAVSLRLDPDVIAKFKAAGPGWQTRINDALRKSAGL